MSWRCPYCNQIATLVTSNVSDGSHSFNNQNRDGHSTLKSRVVVCPNSGCREYTIEASLHRYRPAGTNAEVLDPIPEEKWRLKPQSAAKPIPEYVPQPIRDDYKEACLIVDLCAKASATLSRRCLQGMIRDFHKISKDRLVDEIKALKGHIDQQTWNAIDAVRSIGNIGAHMEKDIDTIIDVDPGEAALLIELIETLIEEWYVHPHDRNSKMDAIIAIASAKKDQKNQPSRESNVAAPMPGVNE